MCQSKAEALILLGREVRAGTLDQEEIRRVRERIARSGLPEDFAQCPYALKIVASKLLPELLR